MRTLNDRRGQNTAEYAILIAVVIGAVIVMQVYMKRSIQGKVKDVTDHVGDGLPVAWTDVPQQYEPYYASSNYAVKQHAASTEKMAELGAINRTDINETTTRAVGGTSKTGTNLSADVRWNDELR